MSLQSILGNPGLSSYTDELSPGFARMPTVMELPIVSAVIRTYIATCIGEYAGIFLKLFQTLYIRWESVL